jgi:hypothetical protein
MMVSQDLHWVPHTLEIIAQVVTGHDNSKHLLIAYGIVPFH